MELLIGAHSQLKKIQDHLLRVDAEIKTAMPPIECLPVEMLVQVFKEATSEMGDALDMRWEPFVISRVCRKWRVVATERCPEIWTEFILEPDGWGYIKNPMALLSLVLSRGAERSLEFKFGDNDLSYRETEQNWSEDWPDEDEDADEDEDEIYASRPSHLRIDDGIEGQLLQNLVRHCHRWRDVYFCIPTRLFHLLSPIRGKLLALVLFSIDCLTEDFTGWSSSLTESYILDGAPLLETVSVSCLQYELPVLIPQGVPNLTSYTDSRARNRDLTLYQHFLNIIRTSPHLKSFSIRYMCLLIVPTPLVVHPGITHLSTSDGSFLRSLRLPGLKNMELYDSARQSPDIYYGISSLYDLVIHSACNLSSLKVVDCAVNENLIHILEASPDLTSLTLQKDVCDDESVQTIESLFDRLRSFEHVLVPRLQSLTLTGGFADLLDTESTDFRLFGHLFEYCIEDRWRKGILRSVTVTFSWERTKFTLSQGFREKMIRLKDEGMDVEFSDSQGESLLCL